MQIGGKCKEININRYISIIKLALFCTNYNYQNYLDFGLKIIKINNMKKNLLGLIVIFFLSGICYAEQQNQGYAGTPPNFYDDIDPNSIEQEDEDIAPSFHNNQSTVHEYTEDSVNLNFPTQTRATKDYASIYNNLEPATHSYIHNIDPDEFYDEKDATWSIYPLLRLNSPIYFKNIAIEPGYYLLTPREHKGKWYMLFKQNGKIVYIIPVYERDYTPEGFYDKHIPKPKLKPSQKVHMKILDTVAKAKSSKRKEPVKSYLEVNDLDNYFINIIIYYGNHKYSTIYRTIRL